MDINAFFLNGQNLSLKSNICILPCCHSFTQLVLWQVCNVTLASQRVYVQWNNRPHRCFLRIPTEKTCLHLGCASVSKGVIQSKRLVTLAQGRPMSSTWRPRRLYRGEGSARRHCGSVCWPPDVHATLGRSLDAPLSQMDQRIPLCLSVSNETPAVLIRCEYYILYRTMPTYRRWFTAPPLTA